MGLVTEVLGVEEENTLANNLLGKMFFLGKGCEVDLAKAEECLTRAASTGDALGCHTQR